MGLFSNRCENPDCNARVKKGARFCTKCGYAGPNSLTKCPECGKRVGGTNTYCWACGAEIAQAKAPRIKGNYWIRQEEEFAVRVEPDDLKGLTKRQLGIEAGTVGILGKSGKTVGPGVHTLDGLFKITAPTSIILVNASGVVLRPHFSGLRDARGAELDMTVQVVLQVKDYQAFFNKYFQGHRRRVTEQNLEEDIRLELTDVLRSVTANAALEDMPGNLEWRNSVEDKLRAAMTVTLDRAGIDLVQLNFVELGGDHYEELMKDKQESYEGHHAADHMAEMQAIRHRVIDLENEGKLKEISSDKELQDQVEEMNAQYDVKSVMRDSEVQETIAQAKHEAEIKRKLRDFEVEDLDTERGRQLYTEQTAFENEAMKANDEFVVTRRKYLILARQDEAATESIFRREQEKLENQHLLEESWKQSEQRRQEERADAVHRYELLIKEAQSNLEATRHNVQAEIEKLAIKEREGELDHEQKKRQLELMGVAKQQEAEQMTVLHKMDMERKQLKYDQQRFEIEQQTRVRLAEVQAQVDIAGSDSSKDAAVSKAVADQLEQRLRDQQTTTESFRSDAARQAQDLKDIVGITTGNQQQPTVVVAGPGGAQTVGGGAPQQQQPRETPCPQCQRPVPLEASFCPWCKHDMKS